MLRARGQVRLTGPQLSNRLEPTCAVLGSPIAHSLSPTLHLAAYRALGLHWSYQRHEMSEDGLAAFVTSRPGNWRGLSLTMPLKQVALTLGEVDPVASLAQAANTLIFDPDGGRSVFNTDVDGLVNALRGRGVGQVARAVVLGSGSTARSALVSLSRLGCPQVFVLARSPARAEPLRGLAAAIGVELIIRPWPTADTGGNLPTSDLLVSTAPAGAVDGWAPAAAAAAPVIFDVVYHPWPTRLAAAARAAGCTVVNGLELLAHQAVGQVELMTGRTVPAAVLLSAGQEALSRRQAP